MFLVDILIACLIAIIFALPLVAIFGWRPYGDSTHGAGGGLLIAIPVFLLIVWIANLAFRPLGPAIYERQWVPGLLAAVGLFVLFMALIPPPRSSLPETPPVDEADAVTTAIGFTLAFWILLLILVGGVLGAYWWWGV
ncbi:MAG: hypothetical protein ACOCZK_03705 [Planctomycetota bacterium]